MIENMTVVAIAFGEKSAVEYYEKAVFYNVYYFESSGKKFRKSRMIVLDNPGGEEAVQSFIGEQVDVVICRNFSPRGMARLRKAGINCATFTGGHRAAMRAWQKGNIPTLF